MRSERIGLLTIGMRDYLISFFMLGCAILSPLFLKLEGKNVDAFRAKERDTANFSLKGAVKTASLLFANFLL